MYNLPTLQHKHPKLKQLNNWTGNCGGLFDGYEENEDPTSSPSFSQVTVLDLGEGRTGLNRKTLPPITATSLANNEGKFEGGKIDEGIDLSTNFAKVSPLPPVKEPSGGSRDVVSQASKHIQDYKNDIRRINECLETAKQQQADSLLEKKKLRQQLKDAEIEEKKQREALDSSKMIYYEEGKSDRIEMEDHHDGGGTETKEEKDEVEEEMRNEGNKNLSDQEFDDYNMSRTTQPQTKQISPVTSDPGQVVHLNQRHDSIHLVKVEGTRKKSLKKFIKFAVILLLIVVFGITLILFNKSKPDEIRSHQPNDSNSHMGISGKLEGAKRNESESNSNSSAERLPNDPTLSSTSSPSSSTSSSSSLPSTVSTMSGASIDNTGVTAKTSTANNVQTVSTSATKSSTTSMLLTAILQKTTTMAQTSTTTAPLAPPTTHTFTAVKTSALISPTGVPRVTSAPVSTATTEEEVDETVTDAEGVCGETYTTTDTNYLLYRINILSDRIQRMLNHRYLYEHMIRQGRFRRRGERLLERVCDLIHDPGNGGMVLIDLQTMAQRLMDLLEIQYSCL